MPGNDKDEKTVRDVKPEMDSHHEKLSAAAKVYFYKPGEENLLP